MKKRPIHPARRQSGLGGKHPFGCDIDNLKMGCKQRIRVRRMMVRPKEIRCGEIGFPFHFSDKRTILPATMLFHDRVRLILRPKEPSC
jgi:hypothetical protein